MYRPVQRRRNHLHRRQNFWARLLTPLTLWICVSFTLRFGYYGNTRMILGPSSSRLVKASSVFVKQVEVKDDDGKDVVLYGFAEKPELNRESNWSLSDYMIVGSYGRKGFSLWLNKGSRFRIRWEAQTSSLSNLQVNIIKGERNYKTLMPIRTNSSVDGVKNNSTYGKEADYTIEEDDRYCIDITNSNPKSIIMTMIINVYSKMYDTTMSKSMCSTSNGSCSLKLMFPKTQYVVVTTPDNGDIVGWYVELSFVARMVTYIAILGFVVIIILVILKYIGACEVENVVENTNTSTREVAETDPIMPEKLIRSTYGTGEEDEECGTSSSSSEDLYDGKICVICYDEQRNCFFVPCGHCATCYDCAQRIMEGETKVCPICRRFVHKVRKLFTS